MSNTSSNFEMAGVLLGKEVRKRKTPQEKIAIIQQTMGKRKANAVCNTCSLQTKLELLLN